MLTSEERGIQFWTQLVYFLLYHFYVHHVFNAPTTSNNIFLASEKLMGEQKEQILMLWVTDFASVP